MGYIVDEWGWSRKKAVWGSCALISVLGASQMLSFGPWSNVLVFNRTLFEFSDLLVSSILLPLCGLLTLLLAGWVLGQSFWEEFNLGKGLRLGPFMRFNIRYVAPAAVAAVLVSGLLGA